MIKRAAFFFSGRHKLKYFKRYETQLKKYSIEGTKMWGNRTLDFNCPKSRRPVEDWLETIDVPFEFTYISIPRNYDEILKQQYGDYMVFPKNINDGKWHQVIEISTDHAFEDVITESL